MNNEKLVDAAFAGDLESLKQLIRSGVDLNIQGALHAAIENENFECVKVLVEQGAKLDSTTDCWSPLAHAVDIAIDGTMQTGGSQGDEPTKIVEFLLAQGADPKPGLEVAQSYGSKKLIQLLQSAMNRA